MALSMGAPLPLNAVVQTQPSTSANAAPRHLDPRTSLAVLAAINVQMALAQSLFAEMGVLALTVVVMAYCRRFSAIVRWLAFYALFAVTARSCSWRAGTPCFRPLRRRFSCTAMFCPPLCSLSI